MDILKIFFIDLSCVLVTVSLKIVSQEGEMEDDC